MVAVEDLVKAKKIKVLLAHPYALLRQTISALLDQYGFELSAKVTSETQLLEFAKIHRTDLILIDWRISTNYKDTINRLREITPEASLVILTQPQSAEVFTEVVMAGAKGYLSLDVSPEDFVNSLILIAKGNMVISKDLASAANDELSGLKDAGTGYNLSKREQEVLGLIARGATNREVSSELYISEHTVKVHLRSVLNKLGLRNRQQAVAYAVKAGLSDSNALE